MSRSPRFLPAGLQLVEVTCRSVQSRHLLRPGPRLNRIVNGVLARAAEKYPVEIVMATTLSNHLHLQLLVESQEHLSRFMQFVNGNIAREVNRLRKRTGPFWEKRYESILVTEEEAAQVARLRYLLAQSVKEGLVDKVRRWPGVHFGKVLEQGRLQVSGSWIDRTRQCRARHRGQEIPESDLRKTHTFRLAKLPCWSHLSDEDYCREIRGQIREIERLARAESQRTGKAALGVRRVLETDPDSTPKQTKKSPAPRVHAASKKARLRFWTAYSWFVDAYRRAAADLRRGQAARFPTGCFPPGLPFVQESGVSPPGG